MLPVIELRGAIPFGVEQGLTIWQSFLVSAAGNIIVGAVIIALLKPVLNWLKSTKLFNKTAANISVKFEKATKKITNTNKIIGLTVFVAVPLPMTGVWTGSAIAVFLGLPFWASLLSVSAGAVISGIIIIAATLLLGDNSKYLFYAFLAAAIICVFLFIIFTIFRRQKAPETNGGSPAQTDAKN
jgi:uncharacterized membrane protein